MDVFDLSVLSFMLARNKNEALGNKYGPDATDLTELEDGIDEEKLGGYVDKKQMEALKSQREA